ncbi:MAG: hypothetical protein QM845_16015, partial [Verrucomicrobiota bacterium]|nr:hypothetical protein [Verrucomicrobiota bacterium]
MKRTVFSFGAVLDEYLERDLGIVLAALLQGGPGTEVPLRSETGIVVSALFFKGFTHVVDFLARAYGDLGFGHRRR